MSPTPAVMGLDAGDDDLAATEHLALAAADLLGSSPLICTHIIRDSSPHYAASLAVVDVPDLAMVSNTLGAHVGVVVLDAGDRTEANGPDARRAGAWAAATSHRDGHDGRAIRFPGDDALGASLAVTEVSARSAIAHVGSLAGPVPEGAVLDTQGHVRPELDHGSLVLTVMPHRGLTFVPFEQPHPHPCCAAH